MSELELHSLPELGIYQLIFHVKNSLKRRREREREARRNESEIQKSKVGGKNNKNYSQASYHSDLSGTN